MNRLAIFDCDGTLVDSGHTIHTALHRTFETHGRETPPQTQSKRVVGLSLHEAMAMLAPDADDTEHARMTQTYKDVFSEMRARGCVQEPLFEGIAPLLDALEADGWLLAVATGKSDRGLKHCLEVHGLLDRFVSLQTADRNPSKPHPGMVLAALAEVGADPAMSVVIGDTAWDMGMARASGCGAIGVAWGYHDEAELWSGGAHAIAASPLEVLGIADRLVRKAA
ncbi:HAD-IA family hydrolase [Sphingomonas arenae]|uniref:HAD-IA family hydrolase n=1 Tax=Sphingomonas arenae TaxID=2812555 RepID=UPI001966DF46|nr:HAD-IA family hydrolase [Sphingomonas arenae]